MDMELWGRVRHKVLVEGQAKRLVMREEGLTVYAWKGLLSEESAPLMKRNTSGRTAHASRF